MRGLKSWIRLVLAAAVLAAMASGAAALAQTVGQATDTQGQTTGQAAPLKTSRELTDAAIEAFKTKLYRASIRVGRVFPEWHRAYQEQAGGKLWAVGAGGTIGSSVDNGRTWRFPWTGTTADLRDILVLAPAAVPLGYAGPTGWAVGDDGTVLTSFDWGRTWRLARKIEVYPGSTTCQGEKNGDGCKISVEESMLKCLDVGEPNLQVYVRRANKSGECDGHYFALQADGWSWIDLDSPPAGIGASDGWVALAKDDPQLPTIGAGGVCHFVENADSSGLSIFQRAGHFKFAMMWETNLGQHIRINVSTDRDSGVEYPCRKDENNFVIWNYIEESNTIVPDAHILNAANILGTKINSIVGKCQESQYDPNDLNRTSDGNSIFLVQNQTTGAKLLGGHNCLWVDANGNENWLQVLTISGETTDVTDSNFISDIIAISDGAKRIWMARAQSVQILDQFGQMAFRDPAEQQPFSGMAIKGIAVSPDGGEARLVGNSGLFVRIEYHAVEGRAKDPPELLFHVINLGINDDLWNIYYSKKQNSGYIIGQKGVYYFRELDDIPSLTQIASKRCQAFRRPASFWGQYGAEVAEAADAVRKACVNERRRGVD